MWQARPLGAPVIVVLALSACTGGTAGSLPDAGPAPLPPEVVIDGPEQLAVGGQAVFRVFARRKGKPVPSEPVHVRNENGRDVFTGVTSADGACDVRFDVAQVAKEGDEEVHLAFQVGTSPSRSDSSRSLSVKSAWRPMLELDHRRVRPGGAVRARLLVLRPDRLAGVAGVDSRIDFVEPSGIVVAQSNGETDAAGQFSASFELQTETPWGEWTVRAKAGDTVSDQFTVLAPPSGAAAVKPPPTPARKPPPQVFEIVLRPASGLLAGGMDNPLVALVTLGGVPAPGAEVVVRYAGAKASGRTGDRGEAWMSLAIPDGGAPVRIKARVSDDRGRRLEREVVLPRHPGGGGLVVRPAFAVAPPGKSIRVQVDGPTDGQVVVDAWRRGRLVATMSAALVSGKAVVDADPEILGPGLVWFVARRTGKGADASWGGAPTFVPPLGALSIRPALGAANYAAGDKAKLSISIEDDMAKPTSALLFGVLREAHKIGERDGEPEAATASRRLAERLLDELPNSKHPAGDLYKLVARGLVGTVPAPEQAVGRLHLAGLRYTDAPGPWPILSSAVTGQAMPKEAPRIIRFAAQAPPEPDIVLAFPTDLKAEAEAPAELELATRDQGAPLAGALVAMADGRLGVQAVSVPLEREFVLSVEAPVRMTAGDTLAVPATIHNLIDRKLGVDLRLELADWFELSDVQQTKVKPGPGGTETAHFRIVARRVGVQEMTFVAKTKLARKTVTVRVDVHPDGRPYEVVRAGVLSERATDVKFSLPPVTKDVPERAYLAIDPSRDRILSRALDTTFAAFRIELTSEAAATRVAALIAGFDGLELEELKTRSKGLLTPQFQRLLRFRRKGSGWAMWRGGPASEAAAEIAAPTIKALAAAGVVGAKQALEGLPRGDDSADDEASARHPSVTSLLRSREGDGGWGSILDTEQAVTALLKLEPVKTPPVEVFVEMDGNPLKKAVFDPEGPPMRVDLPDRLAPGPHLVRIVVPETEVGLPWTLLVRSAVRWSKKRPPVVGWKAKLKTGKKVKRKGKGAMKLALTRTEEAEPGPLAVRMLLPPGARPLRASLDDAVTAGQLGGFALAPGQVDLFFLTETEQGPLDSVGVSFRYQATVPGRFHTPPSALWSLTDPGIVDYLRGPKLFVK